MDHCLSCRILSPIPIQESWLRHRLLSDYIPAT